MTEFDKQPDPVPVDPDVRKHEHEFDTPSQPGCVDGGWAEKGPRYAEGEIVIERDDDKA